jgi:hypothetical protein
MTISTGVFNTTLNPTELNMRSFAGSLTRLFPNGSAPIFGLTSIIGKTKAKSSTHGYFSKTMSFIRQVLAVGVLIGDTDIVVPSTAGMTAGMILHNVRTRENVRINVVNSATNLAVTRAFGRVAAAAMNVTDPLILVGTAFEEGSVRPTARRLATVHVPNYTQIFRDAWALTDTARASYTELGVYDNVTEDRRDCAFFHSQSIETAIIWGQPKMDTTGPTPVHATQGIIDALEQYAPANTNAAASTTTYAQLVSLIEPAFQYSSDMGNPTERLLFGDAQAIRVLNDIGRLYGDIQIVQTETQFGMKFNSFQTYKGTLHMKEHPLLNGLGMTGMALIIDPMSIKLAYMDGRDTKTEEYGSNGKVLEHGIDGVGGSLTTELAVELVNPFANVLIEGLTAAA